MSYFINDIFHFKNNQEKLDSLKFSDRFSNFYEIVLESNPKDEYPNISGNFRKK